MKKKKKKSNHREKKLPPKLISTHCHVITSVYIWRDFKGCLRCGASTVKSYNKDKQFSEMFYPVESLKRGGRFYLCWVADSWPLRFATITHRQLWSQDIRKTCDDLLEVIRNESGRPYKRFSLRLSSQLLHGLIKVYHRKTTVLLNELCMINANIYKYANKKWNVIDTKKAQHAPQLQFNPNEVQAVQADNENEQRVEELLQDSSNVVTNVQDITLKEPTIPTVVLPPDDDFGETHADQPLQQLLQDRTMEAMMAQPDASAAHSALDAVLDTTDRSHDQSRLAPHDAPQMEPVADPGLAFNESPDAELIEDFERDIPELPEIPPASPVPQPNEPQEEAVPTSEASGTIEEQAPEEFPLEELDENELPTRTRRLKKKLIDKQIRLTSIFMKDRIRNNAMELRCQNPKHDVTVIRVSPKAYFRRMCHGGNKVTHNNAFAIVSLFMRNLGVVDVRSRASRRAEAAMPHQQRPQRQSNLVTIEEAPELIVPEVNAPLPVPEPRTEDAVEKMQVDDDIPTQKLETLSQQERKRISERENTESPKRQRLGVISLRASRQNRGPRLSTVDLVTGKENISDNIPLAKGAPKTLSSIRQEARLADAQLPTGLEQAVTSLTIGETARKTGSDISETPLGSLDRTKVSLGESDKTTESREFIRDEWGTEGTVVKIVKLLCAGRQPITVESLVSAGPALAGHRRVIAARCFNSILKLKQHGLINIHKDPVTLEIRDITPGPLMVQAV